MASMLQGWLPSLYPGFQKRKESHCSLEPGEIYAGRNRMALSRNMYPNLISKEELATKSESDGFRKRVTSWVALDLLVCLKSDVFVMTYGGLNHVSMIEAKVAKANGEQVWSRNYAADKDIRCEVEAMALMLSGIEELVEFTNLKSRAWVISTFEGIIQVGTVSSKWKGEIGELITMTIENVGKEGVITIQDGKTLFNELEAVEGMKLDRGYYFITNQKIQKCESDDSLILIHEKKISSINAIIKILELVDAEDVESDALATLILNKLLDGIKVCAIKALGFGENWKLSLQDLAVLTGGQVSTEELEINLDDVELDMLGSCKITISKDDKKFIEERYQQIRSTIALSTSNYDEEKWKEWLAKPSGGVEIGGASGAEVGEKKYRVTDVLNATKTTIEEGVCPVEVLLYSLQQKVNMWRWLKLALSVYMISSELILLHW